MPQQHCYPHQQPAKPGEPRAVEKNLERLVNERPGIFQYVPELGPDHAAHRGVSGHTDRVRMDAITLKVAIERPAGTDGRQPQAKAKSANGKVSDVNEGIHEYVLSTV